MDKQRIISWIKLRALSLLALAMLAVIMFSVVAQTCMLAYAQYRAQQTINNIQRNAEESATRLKDRAAKMDQESKEIEAKLKKR